MYIIIAKAWSSSWSARKLSASPLVWLFISKNISIRYEFQTKLNDNMFNWRIRKTQMKNQDW